MMYLTRIGEFSAAHRLYVPEFDDVKNEETFGKCTNYYGHGHNYKLEVTITGDVPADTGMVLDLKIMGEIIDRVIVDEVDHKHLNFDVDFLQGIVPTAENLAIVFWERLKDQFGPAKLYEIKLWETDKNIVIYRGDE